MDPRLGPASPHEGAETDPSPRPQRCDWAYKPGEERGRAVVVAGSAGERRRRKMGRDVSGQKVTEGRQWVERSVGNVENANKEERVTRSNRPCWFKTEHREEENTARSEGEARDAD